MSLIKQNYLKGGASGAQPQINRPPMQQPPMNAANPGMNPGHGGGPTNRPLQMPLKITRDESPKSFSN